MGQVQRMNLSGGGSTSASSDVQQRALQELMDYFGSGDSSTVESHGFSDAHIKLVKAYGSGIARQQPLNLSKGWNPKELMYTFTKTFSSWCGKSCTLARRSSLVRTLINLENI